MKERERKREREKERQTDRQTDREKEREREKDKCSACSVLHLEVSPHHWTISIKNRLKIKLNRQ